MIAGAIERVTDVVLRALARDEAPIAPAVRFLLRRYAATGRDEIRDALEPALARALDEWPQVARDQHPGWLMLFADAAAVSDDDRLRNAAGGLTASLREAWGRESRIAVVAVMRPYSPPLIRGVHAVERQQARRDHRRGGA